MRHFGLRPAAPGEGTAPDQGNAHHAKQSEHQVKLVLEDFELRGTGHMSQPKELARDTLQVLEALSGGVAYLLGLLRAFSQVGPRSQWKLEGLFSFRDP